jgi:hypothetical protein
VADGARAAGVGVLNKAAQTLPRTWRGMEKYMRQLGSFPATKIRMACQWCQLKIGGGGLWVLEFPLQFIIVVSMLIITPD